MDSLFGEATAGSQEKRFILWIGDIVAMMAQKRLRSNGAPAGACCTIPYPGTGQVETGRELY
jgi:hypothetical protein